MFRSPPFDAVVHVDQHSAIHHHTGFRPRRLALLRRASLCAAATVTCVASVQLVSAPGWAAPPPRPDGTYELHATRAILHLCLVPEPQPAKTGIPGPGLPPEVRPLGLLGRTIGGSFFVDWDSSPFGRYREVGLLSSLVVSAIGSGLAWGGWASHIWVNEDGGAEGGRRIWGLPTSKCNINVETAGSDGKVLAFGSAPLIAIGDGVGPLGRIDRASSITVGSMPWGPDGGLTMDSLELPSLSGCLPDAASEDVAAGNDCRRLLTYSIGLRPKSSRILPGRRPSGGDGVVPRVDFSQWLPLFSVELNDVEVAVGAPRALG